MTRIIPLDGTAARWANASELPMGDSRGRWEGNTLVVDVTNFNDKTWILGQAGGEGHVRDGHAFTARRCRCPSASR